jgi:hypothetical protein
VPFPPFLGGKFPERLDKRMEDAEHYFDGLRKAGLPEALNLFLGVIRVEDLGSAIKSRRT